MSSSWRRRSRAVPGTLGALLVLACAAGCGSSSSTSSATTSPASTPNNSSGTATSTAAASAPSTAKSAQPSRPSTPALPAAARSGTLLHRYTGMGDYLLGKIVAPATRVLVWSAHSGRIQIFTASGFMLVNSQSATGSVRLARGTYSGVRVATAASWSLELRS